MFVAAAFCPHPPLLVPELAAGAAVELDGLRAACDDAVRRLLTAGPQRLYVLGAGPRAGVHGPSDHGSLAGYGVDVRVRLGPPTRGSADGLPLSVAVGAWLLGRAGDHPPAVGVQVGPDGTFPVVDGGAAVGSDGAFPVVDGDAPVGLLVMGDGSARRTESAPGYVDPRAVPYDDAVTAALRSGDPAELRVLDPALGAELLAAGPTAWRAAGGLLDGGRYDAELLYAGAPYGVGYFVASWIRR